MLAIDRGNSAVQDLYNEMHPAILYQLAYVIRTCKRYNVETSVCGQAGSRKDMVKFLVEQGISSITVNADAASSIAEYIAEIEAEIVRGTDKEPRKYHPEKNLQPKGEFHPEKNSQPNGEFLPEIRGSKKPSGNQESNESLEGDIEAIEKEKEEYLESHPEESSH